MMIEEINTLINSAFKISPDAISSLGIVNGTPMNLDDIEKMGYREFSFCSKINMPKKLFKYYPNTIKDENGQPVNYSQQSLKSNTVFMQSPNNFDDVYDSDINIDYMNYQKYRLIDYCQRCDIEVNEDDTIENIGNTFLQYIWNSINQYKDTDHIFIKKPDSVIEEQSDIIFQKRLLIKINEGKELNIAVQEILNEEYNEFSKELKEYFRISCFTTTPFSQLMWGGAYADCHKGFCVEYTILPDAPEYSDVYYNLFPVIYCKSRPNITKALTKYKDSIPTMENMWYIYLHGALRKSVDWFYQNEWRLLLPPKMTDNYLVKFFPITKVYLGNRMNSQQRKEIIDICKEQNIPYIGVKRKSDIYEMQECEILCEDCENYKSGLFNSDNYNKV